MSEQAGKDRKNVEEYLGIIEERIVKPIRETDIAQYCTATLLLLFPAMDALGKLIHPTKDKPSHRECIKEFCRYMGNEYLECESLLYDLRNALVHNAINVASFMRSVEEEGHEHKHLDVLYEEGDFLVVNTSVMFKDFCEAIGRLREEIVRDEELLKRMARRLVRGNPSLEHYAKTHATPPPMIEFLYAR